MRRFRLKFFATLFALFPTSDNKINLPQKNNRWIKKIVIANVIRNKIDGFICCKSWQGNQIKALIITSIAVFLLMAFAVVQLLIDVFIKCSSRCLCVCLCASDWISWNINRIQSLLPYRGLPLLLLFMSRRPNVFIYTRIKVYWLKDAISLFKVYDIYSFLGVKRVELCFIFTKVLSSYILQINLTDESVD